MLRGLRAVVVGLCCLTWLFWLYMADLLLVGMAGVLLFSLRIIDLF